MAFRYKDLLVTVLPPGLRAADCTGDTVCGGACSNQHTDCPGGCSNAASDFHTTGCNEWRINPADFVEIKVLLRNALDRLELAEARSASDAEVLPHGRKNAELTEAVHASIKDLSEGRAAPVEGFAGMFRVRDLLVTVLPTGKVGECDGGITRECPGGCSNAESKILTDPDADRILPAELQQFEALLRYTLTRAQTAAAASAVRITDEEQARNLSTRLRSLAQALGETRADQG